MRILYQASFFANLGSIEANTANTLKILTELSSRGLDLLPTTVQEISLPMMKPIPRLRFASANGDMEVNIGATRLDVIRQRSFTGIGADLGSVDDFAELVNNCLASTLQGRGLLANRLALIVKAVDDEYSVGVLDQRFQALFNAPDFYRNNAPTEWTFRANSISDVAFAHCNERLNTITKIERSQGQAVDPEGTWTEFDRIFKEYDLNTVMTNGAERFPYEVVREFVRAASNIVNIVGNYQA